MTRSQIERLGARLVSASPPAQEDLDALHELLVVYSDALAQAVADVQEQLGIVPTSRVKNTGTILEKLERFGGSWLKSIEDLAGMRIVGGFDRDSQDELVEQLVALFDRGGRPPKVVDRRERPAQGYTAVHVIAFVDGLPVEIQVRTRLQHEWADLFEKLADLLGRGIRYGEPLKRHFTAEEMAELSPDERDVAEFAYRILQTVVDNAKSAGEQIRLYESAHRRFSDERDLAARRAGIDSSLRNLRELVAGMDREASGLARRSTIDR